MPLVHIDLREGRAPEYHHAVLKATREALVETIGVGHERIIQRIHGVPDDCFDVPPGKTDQAVVIEIAMLEGRSPDQKAALYDDIRRRLVEDPGIPPEDVFVIVRDKPSHDLCLGTSL